MKIVKNDLFDYKNIYQYVDGFKFSLDSLLLAEFVDIKKSDKTLLDLCTGNCPIPLVISTRQKIDMVAFELQQSIYELAVKSIKENKLENQIKVINDDIKNINEYFKGKYFDIITCNPPYFKCDESSHINELEILSIARHEIAIDLEQIFNIVAEHLNNGGRFYMVHKADRLDEIMIYANKYNLGVKVVQLISTNKLDNPSIVLVKCVKNSKKGVIVNPIINVMNKKTYQNMFRK